MWNFWKLWSTIELEVSLIQFFKKLKKLKWKKFAFKSHYFKSQKEREKIKNSLSHRKWSLYRKMQSDIITWGENENWQKQSNHNKWDKICQ